MSYLEKMFGLQGKTAVVSGGAGVIGTIMSEALLKAGADPHACGWSTAPKKTALILAQNGRKKGVIPSLAEAMGAAADFNRIVERRP